MTTEETHRARIHERARFRLLLSGLSGSRVEAELPCACRAGGRSRPNTINANLRRASSKEKTKGYKRRKKGGEEREKKERKERGTFSLLHFLTPFKYCRRFRFLQTTREHAFPIFIECLQPLSWVSRRSFVFDFIRITRMTRYTVRVLSVLLEEGRMRAAAVVSFVFERERTEETVLTLSLSFPLFPWFPVAATSRRFPRRVVNIHESRAPVAAIHPPGRHETVMLYGNS